MAQATGFELITLEEAKEQLFVDGDSQDPLINSLITTASVVIDEYVGRPLVTRASLVEFHTFWEPSSTLWLLEWPAITITEVAEDIGREYAAASLLVVSTDYISVLPKGKLIRVSGSGRSTWQTGFEAVRVTYTGGYANTAAIPHSIKGVARRLVALYYREIERKEQGMTGMSDTIGNFTRIGAAKLTDDMKRDLNYHRANEFAWTGERHT